MISLAYTARYQRVYSNHSINARCTEPTLGDAYRYNNTEVISSCLYTFRLVSSASPVVSVLGVVLVAQGRCVMRELQVIPVGAHP